MGLRYKVTLNQVATQIATDGGLVRGFYTFCNDLEIKTLSETNDVLKQRVRSARVSGQLRHERAVDLEYVYIELAKCGKRGMPRTEVVQSDPYTQLERAFGDDWRTLWDRSSHNSR